MHVTIQHIQYALPLRKINHNLALLLRQISMIGKMLISRISRQEIINILPTEAQGALAARDRHTRQYIKLNTA